MLRCRPIAFSKSTWSIIRYIRVQRAHFCFRRSTDEGATKWCVTGTARWSWRAPIRRRAVWNTGTDSREETFRSYVYCDATLRTLPGRGKVSIKCKTSVAIKFWLKFLLASIDQLMDWQVDRPMSFVVMQEFSSCCRVAMSKQNHSHLFNLFWKNGRNSTQIWRNVKELVSPL